MAFNDKDIRSNVSNDLDFYSRVSSADRQENMEWHQPAKGSGGRGSRSLLGGKIRQGKKFGDEEAWAYFIQGEFTKYIKIGYTNDLSSRLGSLQTGSSEKLSYIGTILFSTPTKAHEVEKCLHIMFDRFRSHGEWFKPEKDLLDFIETFKKDSEELHSELKVKTRTVQEKRINDFVASDPNEVSRVLVREGLLERAWKPTEF
jgi:hypothetical protein